MVKLSLISLWGWHAGPFTMDHETEKEASGSYRLCLDYHNWMGALCLQGSLFWLILTKQRQWLIALPWEMRIISSY